LHQKKLIENFAAEELKEANQAKEDYDEMMAMFKSSLTTSEILLSSLGISNNLQQATTLSENSEKILH
jgi:hypothetical protein